MTTCLESSLVRREDLLSTIESEFLISVNMSSVHLIATAYHTTFTRNLFNSEKLRTINLNLSFKSMILLPDRNKLTYLSASRISSLGP